MAARNVSISMMPFAHESFGSGTISGSEPYFEAEKNALWTPIRQIPAS